MHYSLQTSPKSVYQSGQFSKGKFTLLMKAEGFSKSNGLCSAVLIWLGWDYISQNPFPWFRVQPVCSVASLCLILCNPMDCCKSGLPIHHNTRSLLTLMSIESMMPYNHLTLCCPLLFPPAIFPSMRGFSNESVFHIRWPKYWSCNFSISPSYEYSGLMFFRMDWLDLLAIQGTLESLSQHHSSEASILWCSAFFILQLWHPHMTTGETKALTRWTFVGKVMSLFFNKPSRQLISFIPRGKIF